MQSDKLTFYYIVIVPMMRRGCKREKYASKNVTEQQSMLDKNII